MYLIIHGHGNYAEDLRRKYKDLKGVHITGPKPSQWDLLGNNFTACILGEGASLGKELNEIVQSRLATYKGSIYFRTNQQVEEFLKLLNTKQELDRKLEKFLK